MKKQLVKITAFLLIILYVATSVSFAANDLKVQYYFSPGIMDDTNGEIVVDVNIRNFDAAVPNYYGDICGVTFGFEYKKDKFDIKTLDNGTVDITLDDETLIKNLSDVEITSEPGRVNITFIDSTLEKNLINTDGTLLRFTLISNNPRAFWNSNDRYPLTFSHGSLGLVMFNTRNANVSSFTKLEGIDYMVGAYNTPPAIYEPIVPDVEEETEEDVPVVPDKGETSDKNDSSDNKTEAPDVSVDNEKEEDNKDNESSTGSTGSFKPSGVPSTTTPVTSGGGSYKPINGTKVPANADAYRYIVSFKADSTDIIVGSETKATDAKSYSQNGRMMVPMRYFAENVGMTVDWDGDQLIASAYGNFKSLKILEKDCIVYVNAVKVNPAIPPINLEGRFFISSDVIAALYPNAKIVETTDAITIYIP